MCVGIWKIIYIANIYKIYICRAAIVTRESQPIRVHDDVTEFVKWIRAAVPRQFAELYSVGDGQLEICVGVRPWPYDVCVWYM